MKYAILIDAGFLKRKLGPQAEPLDVNVRTWAPTPVYTRPVCRWIDCGVYRKSTELFQAVM